MDEEDPEQQRVMALLEPFFDRIHPRFPNGLALYNDRYPAQVRAEHDDRAAASAVYCHIWSEFQREFLDEPGFHFLDMKSLHLLNMRDELVIRVKKVDANGRHRNAQTPQQMRFDAQLPLPGLPPAATRVVIGYQPDLAFAEVERVIVRRPRGRWVSQIVDIGEAYSWVDITPVELPLRFRTGRRAAE